MKLFCRLIPAVALVSLLVLSLPPQIASADGPYFSDNFNDNTLDSSLWVDTEYGGPTAAEVNHRLEITVPATSHDPSVLPARGLRAGYASTFAIQGDFDVQVDFELLTWPPNDGIRVGIIMDENPHAFEGVQWINVQRSNPWSSEESYLTHLSTQGLQGMTATNDSAGRLRQVRLGDALSAYYWNSPLSDWTLLYKWTGAPTTDLYVWLLAWSHNSYFGDKDALVAFDNLVVSSPGVNASPNQPTNLLPIGGATAVSVAPTLQSSAFSDPDPGDTHAASQWQVTTTAGDYSSPTFDSGTDASNLSSITTPSLSYATTYYWHVRHQDNHGAWAEWSTETSFTTLGRSPKVTALALPFAWVDTAFPVLVIVKNQADSAIDDPQICIDAPGCVLELPEDECVEPWFGIRANGYCFAIWFVSAPQEGDLTIEACVMGEIAGYVVSGCDTVEVEVFD